MGRRLTMLATVIVLPGGIAILIAVALAIALMRTPTGQRLLVPLKRRIPPQLRARAKRILALATGEKRFLPAATHVHPV